MLLVKKLIGIFFLLLVSGFFTISKAQETGLNILTVGPNSRALGLNEAVTAQLNGASNIYTNPANLTLESSSGASLNYNLWIGGTRNRHAAVNLKKNSSALAFGMIASEIDELRLNGSGAPDGTFSSSLLSLAAAYAHNWRNISAGITGQYLYQKYNIYNASGYSLNLGIAGRWWNEIIHTGITLQNLGRMNELLNEPSELPTIFRAGIRVRLFHFFPPKNEDLPIWISLQTDYVNPLQAVPVSTQDARDPKAYVNMALTFDIAETVAIYGGYRTGNNVRPWSAGVSIIASPVRVNYAIVPFETGFSPAHSFGIEYLF